MSIVIGRIENKFGSNSGHKFPNGFPVYEEKEELKSDTPNMNDFMSGTIYLYGDSWNHCKYEDAYYSLYIVHLVSHRSKRYLYRLERDLWMDVLLHRPNVIGDLANSNNDKLLEANLNRTISALDNPARVITINFGDVTFDGVKSLIIRESKKDLPQTVLARDNFDYFISQAQSKGAKNGKHINGRLYSINYKSYDGDYRPLDFREGCNPATFIFAYLKPSTTLKGWKYFFREKINEFIKSIETLGTQHLKLSKLNAQAFATSPINGNYCVTHKVDGISTTEESVKLKEIDLSNLQDIIPINIHNLKEVEPSVPLFEGDKAGLFDVVDAKPQYESPLVKIRRKCYLPINATPGKTPQKQPDDGPFTSSAYNWDAVQDPQYVTGGGGGRHGRLFLWFVDNLNFVINTNADVYSVKTQLESFSDLAHLIVLILSLGQHAGLLRSTQLALEQFSFFDPPMPYAHFESPFNLLKNKEVVPFGLLIYGIRRNFSEGSRYEYIGKAVRKDFVYYSGIKKSVRKKYYGDPVKDGGSFSRFPDRMQPTGGLESFYLDNYYLSGLCFFPPSKNDSDKQAAGMPPSPADMKEGYSNFGPWGIGHFINYRDGWTTKILNFDLYAKYDLGAKPVGKKHNPFNSERFPKERERIDFNINECFNQTVMNLPDGLTIEEGDYFFSDLDYELVQYPGSDYAERFIQMATGAGSVGHYVGRQSILPGAFLLEDMMKIKDGKLFANKPGEKLLVLCTTNDGNCDLRALYTFEREQSVNSSEDELVDYVEGSRQRNTLFTLIKKLSGNLLDEKSNDLEKKEKEIIIHSFYKLHGYKTKLVEGTAHWTWFNEADFSPESNLQQLFDLVGTDGYAFFAKGKISLIAKKASLFEPHKGQSSQLLHSENKDLDLSLIEKINQKVRFQFFGAPYYLNGKSSFSEKDKITLSVEALKPTELQTQFDQYFIRLDTEFDTIYYENISLPKKQYKGISPADSVQLERLNLDLAHAQYSYQIDVDRHKIATDRFNESIRRAETDLYHQKLRGWLQLGSGAAASSFGVGLKGKYRQGRNTVTTIKKRTQLLPEVATEDEEGVRTVIQPQMRVPIETKTIKHIPGKTPNIIGGLISGALTKAASTIMDYAFTYPEQERRIGFDKQIGAAELALESLAINTAFMEAQINHQTALNQITNAYANPLINEREVMENFMDKDEGHGKKLKPAHLICFVPSEEQLVALRSFKEEFGVMCDIPDVEINFYEGMKPDVIRYRNLDDKAIKGLPNEGMRVFLHGHLLAGIKVVQTTSETYDLMTADDYQRKIFRLNSDLLEKANEIGDKDKQITLLNTQMEEKQRECEQEASELQKRITETENQVNQINKQLRDKIAELSKLKEQCEAEKAKSDEIAKQLSEANIKVADLEKIKAQCEKDKKACADLNKQLSAVRDEVTKLNQNLEEKINALAALNADYQAKVRELDVCKTDKETNDAALRKQIESLKQESETRKERVEELTQQLNDERRKYLDERDKLNTLSKTSSEERAKLQELIKQINEQIDRISKELEAYKKTKKPVLATPEDCIAVKEIMTEIKVPTLIDREDGFNEFLDLLFALAESKDVVHEKYNNAKGWQGFADAAEMKKFEDAVNELMELDIVEQAYNILKHNGWSKYQEGIRGSSGGGEEEKETVSTPTPGIGTSETALTEEEERECTKEDEDEGFKLFIDSKRDHKSYTDEELRKVNCYLKHLNESMKDEPAREPEVDDVITKINNLKDYEGAMSFYGLKTLMDEANYEAYIAVKALHEKIGTDKDLAYYFKHVYPMPVLDKYIALFGNPNLYIIRKLYTDEVDCTAPTEIVKVLKDYKTNVDIKKLFDSSVGAIPVDPKPKPATPEKPKQPAKPKVNPRGARSLEEAKFATLPLKGLELHGPYANPMFIFEDSKATRDNLRNRDYKGTFDGKSYTFKTKPKISVGMQLGKYPYWKRVEEGSNTKKVVGFGGISNVREDYLNYFVAEDLKRVEMKEQFNYLIENIDRIKIPDEMIHGIKNHSRHIKIRFKTFYFSISADPNSATVLPGLLTTYDTLYFNELSLSSAVHGPENKLPGLLKYIFIFHYLYVAPKFGEYDVDDSYKVYSFETGKYHPSKTSLRNEALLNKINESISNIIDQEIDLQLGMLFNPIEERLSSDGDLPDPPNGMLRSSNLAMLLSLFIGIYGHMTGKKKYDHPFDGGKNHIYYMLHRLSEV